MIVIDGRRGVHDLGARRVWEPSLMKMVGASGTTGTGRWSDSMMTINLERREPRASPFARNQVTLDDPCLECGKTIVTFNPTTAIYCGTKCRNKVAKRRQRERCRAPR